MVALGAPNGLRAVGFHYRDIPALAAGTLPQKRGSLPARRDEGGLGRLFEDSTVLY